MPVRIAQILSAAMMLRFSFGLTPAADAVEAAVRKTIADGLRTGDIYSGGMTKLGTAAMGDIIAARISC